MQLWEIELASWSLIQVSVDPMEWVYDLWLGMVIDDDGEDEYLDLCMCLLWGGRCRQMDVQHRLHILTLNLQHTEIHNGNGKSQFVTPLKVNLDQNSFVSNCWDLVLRKEHTFGKGEGSQCWVYTMTQITI